MSVNGVSNQSGTSTYDSGVTANDNTAAGMNNLFMQLLVAQIQNQDPLNPTDGTEYVSQLAQLTQVQSMETMSKLMANNAVLMDNLQTLTTGNLVGQKVMVQTDTVETDGSTNIDGRLTLDHAANTVTVIVKDESGNETKIELGKQEKGTVDFNIDPDALGLKEGKYTLSVVTDTEETKVPIEVGGVVNNVRIPLDGSPTLLNITGIGEVAYNNITQFGQSKDKNPKGLMS
ncbi:flagellar hook assembly protein FlgD [Enterobacter huaxiensis]|jgi:flagellar basal-body rod modification protein FlgD|uniref:Basal-body rod modification protein FlgD n=1 Tax=Enterobacter huaxiensis TaxID=2494702 RepID=A0A3R9PPR7_9ENTR|nr:flagellar hook assembly protein FlgD [Enterobacter huaxiensis]MCS5451960.1 flagellar hook assembly protein FlgD [Enterobacter huaxiensis]MEB7544950.1 flagellar hook assembly protein FlgD [Enterobacter huaxiensis]MEB7583201.1 flagellar hook assembly protein FlgD [Enterobacter huaxiensis]MEB7665400.1 flagellar hook assembly protein FlgD [Enterobacter huaxiensis]RSK63474.1 flagellar hook assembly protein FlgD [Enterobacter huaxiensis]